jgi:hypothetical protein
MIFVCSFLLIYDTKSLLIIDGMIMIEEKGYILKKKKKKLSHCHFVYHKSHMHATALVQNPGLHSMVNGYLAQACPCPI